MKKLALISLLVLTAACGKSKENKNQDPSGLETTDQTDRRICQGAPVPGINLRSSTWMQVKQRNDGVGMIYRYTFSENSIRVAFTCTKGSDSMTVYGNVSANVTPSSFALTSADHSRVENTVDGSPFTCEVNVQPTQAIAYSFQGPCLVLSTDPTQILVPSQANPQRRW